MLDKSRSSPLVADFAAEALRNGGNSWNPWVQTAEVLDFQQICKLRFHFYTQAATGSNPVAPNDLRLNSRGAPTRKSKTAHYQGAQTRMPGFDQGVAPCAKLVTTRTAASSTLLSALAIPKSIVFQDRAPPFSLRSEFTTLPAWRRSRWRLAFRSRIVAAAHRPFPVRPKPCLLNCAACTDFAGRAMLEARDFAIFAFVPSACLHRVKVELG